MDNRIDSAQHGQPIDRAFLFSLLRAPHTILLESSRRDPQNQTNYLFHSPVEILSARNLDEIPGIFDRLQSHLDQKRWIAGYVSYECGYHFEQVTEKFANTSALPLLWFGIYDTPRTVPPQLMDSIRNQHAAKIQTPTLTISRQEYTGKIKQLKEYILNGDTYQVNFTDRFKFKYTGDVRDLYFDLRRKQHVPYGAYMNLGKTQLLSFSPELFFRRNDRTITVKPMKGTCKRGRTLDEDNMLSEWLHHDEKNRSENLMIVDLLRNDIGRICSAGSVAVSDMYAVEKYETVLQMTSTVSGTLLPQTEYYDIFRSLFPCGSVTGAPKIRTMQIINEVEQHQRGVYCGAIGYISPFSESVFNVAIRTLELTDGKGHMGVGSGIVFDSTAEKEYEECAVKAAFLLQNIPEFQLLETILWDKGYSFCEEHLHRAEQSAGYFFIPFMHDTVRDALKIAEQSFDDRKKYRVRLLISYDGTPLVEAKEFTPADNFSVIKISPERTRSSDPFLYHKTSNRELYNRYWEKSQQEQIADYVFLNENNEITEGSVSNIFLEKEGKLYTPPLYCGLLPGIYRQEVLRTNPFAQEKVIKFDELRASEAIYICNSLRGWRKVTLSE